MWLLPDHLASLWVKSLCAPLGKEVCTLGSRPLACRAQSFHVFVYLLEMSLIPVIAMSMHRATGVWALQQSYTVTSLAMIADVTGFDQQTS